MYVREQIYRTTYPRIGNSRVSDEFDSDILDYCLAGKMELTLIEADALKMNALPGVIQLQSEMQCLRKFIC